MLLLILLLGVLLSLKNERALGMRNIDRIKGIRHELYTVESAATQVSHVEAKHKGEVPDFDLNYGNVKRRVPNGSDPIHNRRAGKSGEPPAV